MTRRDIINKEPVAMNARGTIFKEGQPVGCKLDNSTLLYLFREVEPGIELDTAPYEMPDRVRAFVVEVENPVTRAKAINAAEMLAYDLHNALEVASFNASLARKARNQEDAEEVREHDEFIAAVKSELTAIGAEK
jgi:hypothetical protein